MLIDEPIRSLGFVACEALTERVLCLDEGVWARDARRQTDYEVHEETQSVILIFCDGWPQVRVTHATGWSLLAEVATPVMEQVIRSWYPPGGIVLRAVLARLPAGCRIHRHKDAHPSFHVAHRIHVPLVTNPEVEFIVGTRLVAPCAHYAFELNNQMFHQVHNAGSTDRIHFIFDYSPYHGQHDPHGPETSTRA